MPDNSPTLVVNFKETSSEYTDVQVPSRTKMRPSSHLSVRAGRAQGETVVSVLMAKTLAHPDLISLAAGFVDKTGLPVDSVMAAATSVLSDSERAREALQYGTTAGYPRLRQAVLDRLLGMDGQTAVQTGLSTEQVVMTAGSNQLLHHLGEILLDPGDIVLCAAPSYFVFLGIVESLGATTVGVAADARGMIPEALESTLTDLEEAGKSSRVKAVYVTSYFDNPAGATLSRDRRPAVLDIARRHSDDHKIYVIEDVAYRELRYFGEDVPSVRSFDSPGDTVIQAGTFSKSFSPGIRVGWGILPEELVEPVLAQKGHLDFGSPNFNQVLMAEVLASGDYDRHVERVRDRYRMKMESALSAADEFLGAIDGVEWFRPEGGLYVWLKLPESLDAGLSGPLFDRAVEEGVLYVPGDVCYPREGVPVARNTIRLSFGIQSCESIREGIAALARAIRSVM